MYCLVKIQHMWLYSLHYSISQYWSWPAHHKFPYQRSQMPIFPVRKLNCLINIHYCIWYPYCFQAKHHSPNRKIPEISIFHLHSIAASMKSRRLRSHAWKELVVCFFHKFCPQALLYGIVLIPIYLLSLWYMVSICSQICPFLRGKLGMHQSSLKFDQKITAVPVWQLNWKLIWSLNYSLSKS